MVQWLGLRAANAGGGSLTPGLRTKIPHAISTTKQKKGAHLSDHLKRRLRLDMREREKTNETFQDRIII